MLIPVAIQIIKISLVLIPVVVGMHYIFPRYDHLKEKNPRLLSYLGCRRKKVWPIRVFGGGLICFGIAMGTLLYSNLLF